MLGLTNINSFSNYKNLHLIYESRNSLVYRAQSQEDNQPVILKVFNQKYPTPEELARYKQEYKITKNSQLKRAITAYNLEKHENTLVIVFEDFGGKSLDLWLKERKLTMPEFLSLGIKITEALGEIHSANIIHKDINPSNIVYEDRTGQLKIIDFGISTILPKENPTIANPQVMEGSLAYISPEQTGRNNCPLDYRTDFYSLGITFYEMLTGRVPFLNRDLLDLLYAHLALIPAPPHSLNSEMPLILSEIIMKLMAKDPDDRYQSAWGIKADLERCLNELNSNVKINKFTLARQDVSDKLQIPRKLYGRKQEVKTLLKAFELVSLQPDCIHNTKTSSLQSEIILVSGYSGIGKSALVKEIYSPITRARGFFCEGKFDQYCRNIPYSAIIQALQQLIKYLLREPESILEKWCNKLQQGLGVNGQLIIDVIPELESIIGSQPPVPSVPPKESQNRFNLVFSNFIKILANLEHPLVIFLDDLQWADGASLKLIEQLIIGTEISHLLLIGAYRNNEVDEAHPLMRTIKKIEQENIIVRRINLLPLELSDINQLIADTFKSNPQNTLSLAKLVAQKTGGNPFFIKEFLSTLYAEGLLHFDLQKFCWYWNIENIKIKDITDNVVALLTVKIEKLSQDTQKKLQLAACIGNRFELKTLAAVLDKTPNETALLIKETIVEGLVMPLSNAYKLVELDVKLRPNQIVEYKFVHDRVQQAAYVLIPERDKPIFHQLIGQIILKSISTDEQLEEKIFDIVNQLNQGLPLIKSQREKDELAKLNLIAGKRAKKATAYEPAFEYLQFGIKLLEPNSWDLKYELTLELYTEATEAAYLVSDYERMESIGQCLQQQAKTLLDRMKFYELKIAACKAKNQFHEAISLAISALKQLGIILPERPTKLDVILAVIETRLTLRGKSVRDLTNISPVTDQSKLAIMRLLDALGVAGYLAVPELFVLAVSKGVKLMVDYGDTTLYLRAFCGYGAFWVAKLEDIDYGYKYGQLSLELLQKFNIEGQKCKLVGAFNLLIAPWKKHLRETLNSTSSTSCLTLIEGYQSGLETGEFEFATFNILFHYCHAYFVGYNLNELKQEISVYSKVLSKLKQTITLNCLLLFRQSFYDLTEIRENPWYLDKEIYSNQINSTSLETNNSRLFIFLVYFNKLILSYLFDRNKQALENAALAESYLDSVMSMSIVPVFYLYDSLSTIEELSNNPNRQNAILRKIKTNQKKMKKWSVHAPMNYLHKYYLVEAERYRILNQDNKAADLYDKAITLAQENEYINEQALANELAAKYYFSRDNNKLGELYLKEAYYCYQKWGALAKLKHIQNQYPQIVWEINISNNENIQISSNTSTNISHEYFDKDSFANVILKTCKEKDLKDVLAIAFEYALKLTGAQTGLVIFEAGEKTVVQRVTLTTASLDSEKLTKTQQVKIWPIDPNQNKYSYPSSFINYIKNVKEPMLINDIFQGYVIDKTRGKIKIDFGSDPYFQSNRAKVKSVMCLPLLSGIDSLRKEQRLFGILYFEHKSNDAFNPDRLDVLIPLCQLIADRIELAVFRKGQSEQKYQYQVGGSLNANSPSYVKRQADKDLYKALLDGSFCYVFNTRQMGKSSLRKQMISKLKSEGWACAPIDLSNVKTQATTVEQWYAVLISNLASRLQLTKKFNFSSWWSSVSMLPPIGRLNKFIEEIALVEIEQKIAIFLDEIDSTLHLGFSMDNFFAQIRSFYDLRGDVPEYERLHFVLLGVATPSSLIQDKLRTPFNIGQAIILTNFKLHESHSLTLGFQDKCLEPLTVLQAIFDWTGGQPFLTQKICSLIKKSSQDVPTGNEARWIEDLVYAEIISDWEKKDEPEHLKTIENRIIYSLRDSKKMLELYRQILQKGQVKIDKTEEVKELLLSGLVQYSPGKLQVNNRIYRTVFDEHWVIATLTKIPKKII